MEIYADFSDEELAEKAKTDGYALESLIKRYKKAVISIVRQYYLIGGEEDDLIQEGTIGLFKAITTFNNASPFGSYAFTCIKSSVIDAVRQSTTDKFKPLNNYVPIYVDDAGDGGDDKNPLVKGKISDPEKEFIESESASEFIGRIKAALSDYEYEILTLYLDGYSYSEIAEKKETNAKSVDNAVQRIRKKIAKVKTDGKK